VTVLAQHFARATWTQLPLSARLSNAPVSYVTYIRKMILPTDLAIFYPHGYALAGGGPPPVFVAACALLLLAITSAVVLLRRTRPYLLTGWLWYLGTLVPVIGLVQVGDQAMADRYTYIPLIGLFIMLAWGTRDIAAAIARRWQGMGPLWATAAALVLLACAVLTWQQVGSWRDPKTLWQHAADVVPNNYFAHTNLGGFAMADGQTDEWLAHCQAAVRAAPGDSPAQSNLAYALAAQGHPAEALQHYSRALELAPTNTRAHQNLANLLLDLGRPKEAAAHCRTALALETDRALAAKVHNSLGLALVAQVQIDDALGEFSKAAELDPAYPQPLYYMGMAQEMRGRSAEAADSYERALRLAPRWADVLRRLALLRATDADAQVRQPDEAVALARKACSLLGRSPSPAAAAQYLDALAAAYAAAGRFPDAVAAADRAHQDAVAGNQNAFAEEIAQRLALYRAGRPFVAPPVKPSPTTRP
jgi:tetratricopeptide (TPR) repeat protein